MIVVVVEVMMMIELCWPVVLLGHFGEETGREDEDVDDDDRTLLAAMLLLGHLEKEGQVGRTTKTLMMVVMKPYWPHCC